MREIRCQFLTLFGFGGLGEALGAASGRNKVSISHVIWLRGPYARQAERAFGLSAPPGPPPEPQNRVKSGIIGSGPSGAAGWPETTGS